ncbi:Uncharacterised protein [Mycobacterium tuberculosis]|nr:Uncharacterised protein [Mycobacterium tuberculosis]COW91162.1 Uncharacterised protein [Mycobacterium tuberculosis]
MHSSFSRSTPTSRSTLVSLANASATSSKCASASASNGPPMSKINST